MFFQFAHDPADMASDCWVGAEPLHGTELATSSSHAHVNTHYNGRPVGSIGGTVRHQVSRIATPRRNNA